MANTIKVEIVSAEEEVWSGEGTMVFAPAEMGEIGIAPQHAPLLTRLKPGEIRVQQEAGDEQLPEEILNHLAWEANTTVYFCMARDNIIETSFAVFKRCWQNFMFLADGSLLLGKKRDAVVQFLETGNAKLGKKGAVK